MKKANVKMGQTYLCKVGRNFTEVRIDREHPNGGWVAINTQTRRKVRVKSAQRLRYPSPLAKAAARQKTGRDTGANVAKKPAKATRTTKAAKERATRAQGVPKAKKKTSLLDAAILVLRETGQPMNTREMVDAVLAKGEWTTKGKTPAATLYASILREIQKKGDDARFVKTERGRFALKS